LPEIHPDAATGASSGAGDRPHQRGIVVVIAGTGGAESARARLRR